MNDNHRRRCGSIQAAWRKIVFGSTVALLLAAAGAAHAVETLKWEDLAPPEPTAQNPVSKMTQDQQTNLYVLFVGPHFTGATATRNEEEQKAYDELKAAGVNPDALLGKVTQLRAEAEKRDNTLVHKLNKKTVKLPGYVLPVDFAGTLVKSFLLVPYVGACIHVPPPPVNQIVYVQADKPFKTDEMFAPVWVTGQIAVGKGKQALELVDGSNDVDFGYSLKATRIDPYEQKAQ